MKITGLNSIVCAALLLVLLGTESSPMYGQQVTFEKKYDFGHNEGGTDLVQTQDGGYFLVGGQTIAINYSNMLMMKTDDHGNLEWHNIIGSGGSANEGGEWNLEGVINVGDTSFFVAGNTNVGTSGPADRGYFLAKLTATGDTVWTKLYDPTTSMERLFDMVHTSDDGFVLAGYSPEYEMSYLVKTDLNGDTLWTRKWEGPYGYGSIYSIIETKDGGLAATGPTPNEFRNPYFDMFLLKMDSLGNEQSVKLYKGHDDNVKGSTYGYDLVQMPDSGFVLGGIATVKENYQWESYLLRVNSSGDTLWSFRNGDNALKDESIKSVTLSKGSVTTSGFGYSSSYDLLLLQISNNGKAKWSRKYGGTYRDQAEKIIKGTSGGYAISGYTDSDCHGCVYFIKTDSMGCVEPGCHLTGIDQETDNQSPAIEVYPNPATNYITLETYSTNLQQLHISLTDLTGRTLLRQTQSFYGDVGQTHQLAVGHLPRGMYVLHLEDEASGFTKDIKILLQ